MLNYLKQNALFSSILLGIVVGVIFIFAQPLFGMTALTQRHAQLYIQSGKFVESSATIIAWLMHLSVSALYGFACYVAIKISSNIWIIGLQALFLGWITTVIAPKANAVIVKLITLQSLDDLSALPPFNFTLDNKFVLHVLFFAVISVTLKVLQEKK